MYVFKVMIIKSYVAVWKIYLQNIKWHKQFRIIFILQLYNCLKVYCNSLKLLCCRLIVKHYFHTLNVFYSSVTKIYNHISIVSII